MIPKKLALGLDPRVGTGFRTRSCSNDTLPFGEMGMAEHAEVEYATATGNDYPAHEHTYRNFVTLVKVSLAIVVVILILMAFFLT
jgi:hypothetical protein